MITIYNIPELEKDLQQLPKFFNEHDTLGGVNNRHIPKLEEKFSKLTNKRVIAVNHCTNGLYLALSKYSPTTVVISPVVFFGVIGAIVQAGHTPYYAPVDITGNIDIDQVDFTCLPSDCIIMNVHMNSRAVDLRHMDRVVIEDAASAFGTCYKDGSDIISSTPHDAVISFSYGKPLTAGEGGMIFTRDNEQFYRTKRYCGLDELKGDYGLGTFDVKDSNIKFPFNALGATLITLQLKRFNQLLITRRNITRELDNITQPFNRISSYQQGNCLTYMMRFDSRRNRDAASKFLTENNIQSYLNHRPVHLFTGLSHYTKHDNVIDSCNDYYSKVLHIACRELSPEIHDEFIRTVSNITDILQ